MSFILSDFQYILCEFNMLYYTISVPLFSFFFFGFVFWNSFSTHLLHTHTHLSFRLSSLFISAYHLCWWHFIDINTFYVVHKWLLKRGQSEINEKEKHKIIQTYSAFVKLYNRKSNANRNAAVMAATAAAATAPTAKQHKMQYPHTSWQLTSFPSWEYNALA